MNKYQRQWRAVTRLVELDDGWAEGTFKPFRFLLLILFSFFTYSIFLAVGKLELAQINLIIEMFLTDPTAFAIGSYIVLLSIPGLYLSVLTASVLASLVPKAMR